MWTRTLLWIVGVLALVVAGPNAYLGMLGSRARAQITPVEDVQWPGLEIRVESSRMEGSSPGQVRRLQVTRSATVLLENTVFLDQWDVSEPPNGFFDGLNADDDAELELVHCDVDIVRHYYDHSDGTVLMLDGAGASAAAKEVCADMARGSGRPDLASGACCFAPLLFLFFLAIRADRRAARGRQDVPTSF